MSLVLHCGGVTSNYAAVTSVPTPMATRSYAPVSNGDLISFVRDKTTQHVGTIIGESYGLAKKDNQLFGCFSVRPHGLAEDGERRMSVGFRNSYDKSLSAAWAFGAHVLVCDNLCFTGSEVTVMRRHTKNVWRDMEHLVDTAMAHAPSAYNRMGNELDALKDVPLEQDAGYQITGLALGHGVLKPQQASVAIKDWKNPRHEEFSENTAYSLYNCFTEGLKRGRAGTLIDRHVATHAFFKSLGFMGAATIDVPATPSEPGDTGPRLLEMSDDEPIVILPATDINDRFAMIELD